MPEKLSVKSFLSSVYEWLTQDRNRSVEEYHYDIYEFYGPEAFRKEIRAFLSQRFIQVFGREPESKFIGYAARSYIKNMFC